MLTAHETVKTAWSNFKSYPRLWQLILFNFIAILPTLFLSVYMQDQIENGDATSIETLDILGIFSSIPTYVVYFLTGMAVTHYVCGNWVFNSFQEFIRPPSSRWKLFWKVFVLYLVAILIILLGAAAFGAFIAILPFMSKIILGGILGIIALGALIVLFTKFILVSPYFTMNDSAPLFASLKFSEGHFWYLSKILGWMSLYGLLFIIAFVIIFTLSGFISVFMGTIGIAIITCLGLIFQSFVTIICMFVYSEAYKQIASK